MLVHVPSIQGDNLLGLTLFVLVAWVILVYFVISGRGKRASARRRRGFYRVPFQSEKERTPNPKSVRWQLPAVTAAPPQGRASFSPEKQAHYPQGVRQQVHAVSAASFERRASSHHEAPAGEFKDVGQQLRAVRAAKFETKELLNYSEYRVFKIIEDDIAGARRGYRVFAQVNLGEILASRSDDGFRSINSKRVDILIVDQGRQPVVAVEYQGSGHYQGTAAARDAVKKDALEKAGVKYVEIFPSDSDEQIRSRVREQLGWRTAAPTAHDARTG